MSGIKFSRVWAMPSADTFRIKPIYALIHRHMDIFMGKAVGSWFDPFARNSPFNRYCVYTNDLSKDVNTTHHMEALDFLNSLKGPFDGCLFDPPYSVRQISECYQNLGLEVHASDTQSSFYSKRKYSAARLIRVGGVVISCGWNSGGFGASLGFELEEVLLVPHGGAHNDTIVTVERKKSRTPTK